MLHFGVRTGAILTTGDASDEIPFVERFFLGGENTVRGYKEGEASPLDENGNETDSIKRGGWGRPLVPPPPPPLPLPFDAHLRFPIDAGR